MKHSVGHAGGEREFFHRMREKIDFVVFRASHTVLLL